jgi:tetratricopeptide (TPR) repeat protein
LNKSSSENFKDKVNLIYEYNKQSPLFVRVASEEIDKNNVERAIDILNDGLLIYPDYPVAHILMGKALMLQGKYKESLDSFRKGSDLVNSHKVYDHYLSEVENIKKQRALFETAREPGFITGDNDSRDKKLNLEDEITSFDAMTEQKPHTAVSASSGDSIVSETLANIYITQGELKEALSIFERLLNKNPRKRDYYLQKIKEIKAELE